MGKFKRLAFIILGFISLGLGIIGVILPVLPTTPFLLLTSFCFVRGSEKFDNWFKSTKIYKKHLESFVKEKAMILKQKVSILLFADFMMAFPLLILDSLHVKLLIVAVILCKYYYFIFKIKTIEPKEKIIE